MASEFIYFQVTTTLFRGTCLLQQYIEFVNPGRGAGHIKIIVDHGKGPPSHQTENWAVVDTNKYNGEQNLTQNLFRYLVLT